VLLREKASEERISFGDGQRGGFAFTSELIVAARGALVCGSVLLGLPFRLDKLVAFEAAKRGIDRAAGQAGDLHDIKAEAIAEAESLEDESRAVGEARVAHDYVVCYHE
jgi:hypothetical protein